MQTNLGDEDGWQGECRKLQRGMKKLWEMNIFTIIVVVSFSRVYTYIKAYGIVHVKYSLYQLYLNKPGFKIFLKKGQESKLPYSFWFSSKLEQFHLYLK